MKPKRKIIIGAVVFVLFAGLITLAILKSGPFSAQPKKPATVGELQQRLKQQSNPSQTNSTPQTAANPSPSSASGSPAKNAIPSTGPADVAAVYIGAAIIGGLGFELLQVRRSRSTHAA